MTLFLLVTHPLTFFLHGIAFLQERTFVDGYLMLDVVNSSLDLTSVYHGIMPHSSCSLSAGA
jgi:hypothetical protein